MGESFETFKMQFTVGTLLAEETNTIEQWAEQNYEIIKNDVVKVAALVTVLNHRCWDLYHDGDEEHSMLYSDLYYKYDKKAWDWLEANGTQEEKDWYFHTMD